MKQITVESTEMKMEIKNQEKLEPEKIRIKVRYSGVGFADLMAVKGKYALAPKRPFSPGYEFSGTVAESTCPEYPVGTQVAGMLPKMGSYREYIDIDPVWAVRIPEGLDQETAAAMPLNYITAMALIEKSAKLKKGDSFLIHGAAGGVGSAAIELASVQGLKAYGTASAAKHGFVRDLGGIPFDYRAENWEEEFRKTEPDGVDAVFDALGAASLNRSWKLLNRSGTLTAYGFYKDSNSGTASMIHGLATLFAKKLSVGKRNTALCSAPAIIRKAPDWYRQTLFRLMDLAAKGKIKPKLFRIIEAKNCREAHALIENRMVKGKILLAFS